MKKSELKTGMWVVDRNGARGMVLLGTKHGDIISGDTNWCSLDEFNDNLERKNEVDTSNDIVKVIQPMANMYYYNIDRNNGENVIWERKESQPQIINITINTTINSKDEIKNIINELKDRYKCNIHVGF